MEDKQFSFSIIVFYVNASDNSVSCIQLSPQCKQNSELSTFYKMISVAVNEIYAKYTNLGNVENAKFKSFWLGKNYWLSENSKVSSHFDKGILVVIHDPILRSGIAGIDYFTEYILNNKQIESWFGKDYLENALRIGSS